MVRSVQALCERGVQCLSKLAQVAHGSNVRCTRITNFPGNAAQRRAGKSALCGDPLYVRNNTDKRHLDDIALVSIGIR